MRLWRGLLAFDFPFALRHLTSHRRKIAVLAATPLALAGCDTPLSTLDPAGPAAANIATLWWIMLWGSVVLFVAVIALLALAVRRSKFVVSIKPVHWIITGGLIMPIPVLLGLLLSALLLGERLLPHAAGIPVMQVEARASQWQWLFSYPERPELGESAVLHLPAGEPVDILVTASDVIHSFWIPRLGGKIDAIPGRINTIRLQADEPGTYRGICAEYCGQGHETMGFVAQAHAPESFATLEIAR